MFKKNIFLLLSGAILVLAILAIGANGFIVEAQAVPANAALSGWAWSSNIGWIKFKSTGTEPAYGVNIVTDTSGPNAGVKRLAGGAWSSSIGWVKFNPTAGPDGYPDDTASKKDAQFSGTNIIGWARACTVFINSDCNGALKDTIYRGGWDGWLKMGGGSLLGGGVRLVGEQLTGFAWGGEVLGWVKFDQVWDGPGDCTGVCIDTGDFTAQCSVTPSTAPVNTPLTFTVTTSNGSPTYNFNMSIVRVNTNSTDGAGVWGSGVQEYYQEEPYLSFSSTDLNTIFSAGNYRFKANVVDSSFDTDNPECNFSFTVSPQAARPQLTLTVIGQGTVGDGVNSVSNTSDTPVVRTFSYDQGADVTLTGTVAPGGTFDWEGDCAGTASNSSCMLDMDGNKAVTIRFTTPPQFCFDVSYERGPGGEPLNSMRVDSRTISNMDEPHESTVATVSVEPLPGQTVTGVLVPLSLNISLLIQKSEDDTVPLVVYNPSLVEVGSSADIHLEFPTDGNTSSNTISPYAGNYQFLINAGDNIQACAGSQSPRINFSYIDFREREQ